MLSNTQTMMTPREASAYLGLSVGRLAKMRLTGDTPPYVKIGASVRYRLSELENWLAGRVRISTSDRG